MRKYLLVLILSGFLPVIAGCWKGDVISEKEMKSILHDMFVLDAYLARNPDVCTSTDSLCVYEPLIESYGYTVDEFNSSMSYWFSDPSVFRRMMNSVRQTLEKEAGEFSSGTAPTRLDMVKKNSYESIDSTAVADSADVTLPSDTLRKKKNVRSSGRRMSRKDLKALEKKIN